MNLNVRFLICQRGVAKRVRALAEIESASAGVVVLQGRPQFSLFFGCDWNYIVASPFNWINLLTRDELHVLEGLGRLPLGQLERAVPGAGLLTPCEVLIPRVDGVVPGDSGRGVATLVDAPVAVGGRATGRSYIRKGIAYS